MITRLRHYFITGLLVWLPMAVTIWVLTWLYGLLDGVFVSVLGAANAVLPGLHGLAEALRAIPGFGVLSVTVFLLVSGVFVANIFGQWWLRQWDKLMNRIPVVRSIYTSVKQVSDTLFSGSGNAFSKALLIRYPHTEAWAMAFLTGKPGGEVAAKLHDAAASPRDRTRHVGGQRTQVHHFHGRGGARWTGQSGHAKPLRPTNLQPAPAVAPRSESQKCHRCVLPTVVW
jgi:uncharacterized membrane protein